MKKRKFKNYLKSGILLIGISLLLFNCDNDNEIINSQEVTERKKLDLDYRLERISHSDLIEDDEIKESLPLIEHRFSNQEKHNVSNKNSTQVAEGLTILTEKINRIVTESVITWTFEIETPILESSDFENFLIKKHSDEFHYFLVSYIKDIENDENLYKKATLYPLSKESLNLDNLNLAQRGEYLMEGDTEGGGDGGCPGKIIHQPCSNGDSYIHGPESYIDGGYCSGSITILDFSHCFVGDLDDIPDYNPSDNDNNSGVGMIDSGGSTSYNGGETITSPVELEDERCPSGSGKIMIDDVCVCPEGYTEDVNGNCTDCDRGYVKDKNGICVKKPCKNDPIPSIEIAPQYGKSKTKGALYGCTRYGGSCTSADGRTKSHDGIDLKSEYGDPIYAMYSGFIYSTKYHKKAGYNTRIQSTVNGETILISYFHMQEDNRILQGNPLVQVNAGDIIGYQGDSGNLKGAIADGGVDSHIHLEVRIHNGSSQWGYNNFNLADPRGYLSTTINDDGTSEENTDCN